MTTRRQILTLVATSTLGLGLGLVDASPNWDDTGISAGVLVLLCLTLGALRSAPAWAVALSIAAWIPLLNMPKSGNAESLMVLPVALMAASAGGGLRAAIRRHAAPAGTPRQRT